MKFLGCKHGHIETVITTEKATDDPSDIDQIDCDYYIPLDTVNKNILKRWVNLLKKNSCYEIGERTTVFCHRIIDLVELKIREVHPFIDKMARSHSVKEGEDEEPVVPNTLLYGEAYYDLENEILELISGLHVVVEVFQGVVSDVSVFTNLADAEEKLEKFKRAHVSEEDERKYGLEHSKIDGSTIFNVQLNGDNTTSNTSKG